MVFFSVFRVEFVFTVMYTVDLCMLCGQEISEVRLAMPFRCLRLAALLCKSKNVSHISYVCLSVVLKLGKVMLIKSDQTLINFRSVDNVNTCIIIILIIE